VEAVHPETLRRTLRIGHSPDPDDAFMWYPLARFDAAQGPGGRAHRPAIDTGPFDFVHVLEDIQSLNLRAQRAELEITAVSIHQYPYIAKDYALTRCGASMGDRYGPMVVTRPGLRAQGLRGLKLAIPGTRTSAWLALQLYLAERGIGAGDVCWSVVGFDQIIARTAAGEFDAGLIIHEGQLTYAQAGLGLMVDLGRWWTDSRGLPLPLGGNAIRRDLGPLMPAVCGVLLESIRYALAHREEAVSYAMHYARDMGRELADRFVGMYVNDWTLDYGPRGREAVRRFLAEGAAAGLCPAAGEVDFVEPG
jgi:1,4-dihydroxy-6-naphthoate synthase